MSDYTVKNLREVENAAEKFGLAPAIEARFAGSDLGLTKSGVSLQRLAPGAVQPFGHLHKQQEELYVIVGGSGRVKIDDDVVDVQPWDAVRIGPGVMRNFAAGHDGLEFIAFGAPAVDAPREEWELRPGWWSG